MVSVSIDEFFQELWKSKLDASVRKFKATFATNPAVASWGQWYISNLVWDFIVQTVNKELFSGYNTCIKTGTPSFDHTKQLDRAWEQTKQKRLDKTLVDKVKTLGLSKYYPNIVKIFSPDAHPNPTEGWYTNVYKKFWENDIIKKLENEPVGLDGSAAKYRDIIRFDRQKCYNTTIWLCKKYYKTNGLPANDGKIEMIKDGKIAIPSLVKPVPIKKKGDKPEPTKSELKPFHYIKYGDQSRLNKVVKNIILALQRGYLVRCGVLSGIYHDSDKPYPNPEHYILLFSYERIKDNDSFVFWDPDNTYSSVSTTHWGNGFGVLFFTGNTFSTAYDADDMKKVYEDNKPISNHIEGHHMHIPSRHRYQVYYVIIVDK